MSMSPRPSHGQSRPTGPGLLDLLIAMGRGKGLIARWTIAAAVAALVLGLVWPKTYTGVTRILPPQQGQSAASALLGQLGGLAGLAGGSLGLKNPSDLYVGMLKSQTVADALIEEFNLRTLYDEELLVDARKRLARDSSFSTDKSGIITIGVEAREPKLAADLANAYVSNLHKLTSTLAVSEAAQRRVFFERQLQQTKEKLAEAEQRLRQGIESGGLVSVDAQGRAAVEMVARLRAQISAKEIQLEAMKGFATPANPDLQRAEREISSMRQELSRLEGGANGKAAGTLGEARGVANIRLMREVKYNELMFELLAKQYEIARVEEAKESPLIQVMDRASPPEKKTGPKRALMVVAGSLAGLFAGILVVLGRAALQFAQQDPTAQGRLAALKAAWSRRTP